MRQRGPHKGNQEVSVAKLSCSGNEGGGSQRKRGTNGPVVQGAMITDQGGTFSGSHGR